jgi:hypothetical protein
LLSERYPSIEWGVLFRPDKEGEPRYATAKWVERLTTVAKGGKGKMKMHLAGHLCGERCRDVLDGKVDFVRSLAKLGFERVQVNATNANGVDSSRLTEKVQSFESAIRAVPEVEWIVQMNNETKKLWEPLLKKKSPPTNMSLLYDASCGMGVLAKSFDPPHDSVPCGYAGGIGPDNVVNVLNRLSKVTKSVKVWIDMESSLREKRDGVDSFSITKSHACVSRAYDLGIF